MHRGLRLAALAAFALSIALAVGCAEDDSTRSVVTVVSINSNMPLESDVRDTSSTSSGSPNVTITDDIVEVTMANYPHDTALDLKPGYPFGDVVFTAYTVTFVGLNGTAPPGFTGSMYLKVPNAQSAPSIYEPPTGYILLVPAGIKAAPPLSTLPDPAGGVYQINCEARVEFYGRETVSNDPVKVTGTVMVSFADYADGGEEE